MLHRIGFFTLLVCLLVFPLVCFAEYKVVIKKNGKVLEGKLLNEDEASVTIISNGIRLTYKKEDLDLARMKELNAGYLGRSDVKTLDRPSEATAPSAEDETQTSLADVARQNMESRQQTSAPKAPADSNEKALLNRISDLEVQGKISPSPRIQMQIVRAKKALNYYKSGEKQLAKADQILVLEELIQALELELKTEKETSASEERIEALRKKIEQKQQQLENLDQ